MSQKFPEISIITVCRNTVTTIAETIQSVQEQKYPNLEYIVIDGVSTDGTLEVLQKYRESFTKFVSEPDKGIYDAMNKGISMATGEWIIFMNAQDRFFSADTLKKIAQHLTDNVDVVYGGYQFLHTFGVSEYRPPVSTSELWKGMNICHQSIFTRRTLLQQHPYDLKYKIVADYDAVLYQLYHQQARFKAVSLPVAILRGGGLSDKKRAQSLREQIMVAEKYDQDFGHKIWRRLNLSYRIFRIFLRDLLPRQWVSRYLNFTRGKKQTS